MNGNLLKASTYEGWRVTTLGNDPDTIIAEDDKLRIVFKRRINSRWLIEVKATAYPKHLSEDAFTPLCSVEASPSVIDFWTALREMAMDYARLSMDDRQTWTRNYLESKGAH